MERGPGKRSHGEKTGKGAWPRAEEELGPIPTPAEFGRFRGASAVGRASGKVVGMGGGEGRDVVPRGIKGGSKGVARNRVV